ncbi:TonB-dependent receptor [Algibacillus agarilyticus]|uniref:TonB-dependent receptor n=1 Tax=Algibacillus agarilyticus TaxID=2234133 RepID=UPI000DD01E08|nr:TonB-dependent receptor [Algibacillus agarilyticus]
MTNKLLLCALVLASSHAAHAHPSNKPDETISIKGHKTTELGQTLSASAGSISQIEIDIRPMLRTGELLEFVPGMVVTQHSGSGKANQYFLRGFNLDHGTDFATHIDGMPVNMRTHGHGQGYTDLNFIIPELVKSIDYKKGTYYAEVGDFSAAGSAQFNLKNKLNQPLINLTLGENAYQRLFAAGQVTLSNGNLLAGLEHQTYSGPWLDIDEDINKTNALLRYTSTLAQGDFNLTLMTYDNSWNSADQIPMRAIEQGIIDPLGSIDPDVGGESSRYSLSGQWQDAHWQLSAYAIQSELNLFSNFTYLLDHPEQGDQFEQVDQRSLYGGAISYNEQFNLGQFKIKQTAGIQLRIDDIKEVGLHRSQQRTRLNTIRTDNVNEQSLGLFYQAQTNLTEKLTATAGIRYDHFNLDVNSDRANNSGTATDGIANAKLMLNYRINPNLETYANVGQGFHSNDARGVTITEDPQTNESTAPVDLLVQSEGAELGMRWFDNETFNISAALWLLQLDSELLFVGDAGNTEASRPSKRYGVELSAFYWFADNWSLDTELAWNHSRFRDQQTDEGQYIDGALPFVGSAGISYIAAKTGWQGSLRYRYFSARALESTNNIKAASTQTINLGVAYQWQQLKIGFDCLNLLDSQDHDITYYYASRLTNEPSEGVEDIHFHPLEPRTFRLKLSYQF